MMPRLVTLMPHADDLNLGAAYNRDMALVPDDAWAALLDHDMHWSTKAWKAQIAEAIATKPDAGAFAVVTNRIDAFWQQAGERENFHMGAHYAFGEERRRAHRTLLDITDTKGFGGVVIVLSKRTWRAIGGTTRFNPETQFHEWVSGGFKDGLLCVDHSLFFAARDIGLRSYLIEGLYVYHRRRAFEGGGLPTNAPRVTPCPCRGAEPTPTVRIPIL